MVEIAREPFRFAELPREMQIYIAEKMDLDTLKALSLTCRAVRADMSAVLFSSIATPSVYTESPARLPPSCAGLVQSARLVLAIYTNDDNLPAGAADLNTLICDFMPNLVNLRKVTLRLHIGHLVDLDNLERPLPVLQGLIRDCCRLSRAAALAVVIHPGYNTGTTLNRLLPDLVTALGDATIRSLTLWPMEAAETDSTLLQAPSESIRSCLRDLLSHVDTLNMVTCWLNWLSPNMFFTNLRRLQIEIALSKGDARVLSALSQMLPAIIGASGRDLESIDLNSDLTIDTINATNFFVAAIPALHRELDHLRLAGYTLYMMPSLLTSVSCRRIDLRVGSWEEWHILHDLVCRRPTSFSHLQELNIHCSGEDEGLDISYPPWTPYYTAIRHAVLDVGARVSLRVTDAGCGTMQDALTSLRHVSKELVGLSLAFLDVPFDHIAAYEDRTLLELPNCTRLSLLNWEYWTESYLCASSLAFTAFMCYVHAPILEMLRLSLRAAQPTYLLPVADAIRRGQFPRLRRVTGVFYHLNDPEPLTSEAGSDRWSEMASARFKKALIEVCADRNISLDVSWQ